MPLYDFFLMQTSIAAITGSLLLLQSIVINIIRLSRQVDHGLPVLPSFIHPDDHCHWEGQDHQVTNVMIYSDSQISITSMLATTVLVNPTTLQVRFNDQLWRNPLSFSSSQTRSFCPIKLLQFAYNNNNSNKGRCVCLRATYNYKAYCISHKILPSQRPSSRAFSYRDKLYIN